MFSQFNFVYYVFCLFLADKFHSKYEYWIERGDAQSISITVQKQKK